MQKLRLSGGRVSRCRETFCGSFNEEVCIHGIGPCHGGLHRLGIRCTLDVPMSSYPFPWQTSSAWASCRWKWTVVWHSFPRYKAGRCANSGLERDADVLLISSQWNGTGKNSTGVQKRGANCTPAGQVRRVGSKSEKEGGVPTVPPKEPSHPGGLWRTQTAYQGKEKNCLRG